MKIVLSHQPGGPETLTLDDVDVAPPPPGSVRVDVAACALNYPDALIIEDRYQVKPPRPFAPGGEISGVIESVGDDVEGWRPGDRVIAVTAYGGLTERINVEARRLHRLPDGCSFTDGAALLLTYGTALHALADRGRMQSGETVLVLGASGGLGVAAVEVAKALGGRVIAAVSSAEKAAMARAAGADATFVYPRGPFDAAGARALSAQFKEAVGADGADIIADPVGGDYAEPALRAIAWGGRYLVLGFTAGLPKLPLNLPLLKACDVCGVFYGAYALREPERNRQSVQRLFDWLVSGRIKPRISDVFGLAQAPAAIARLAAREALGKLVVAMPNYA